MSLSTVTLTPTQVDVLAQVAEREHGTPPHAYARAELRAARALAVCGLLEHVDPDGDARTFVLTRGGADAYDQLPDDARSAGREPGGYDGRTFRPAHAVLRDQQADLDTAYAAWQEAHHTETIRDFAAAEARHDDPRYRTGLTLGGRNADYYRDVVADLREARTVRGEALRVVVLAAYEELTVHVDEIAETGDVPEHTGRYAQLSAAFAAAEDAYTAHTGLDPFVGLTVTLPETGTARWTITDRSRFHGTCELTSPTGDKYCRWVAVSYALAAGRARDRLVPAHPERHIPATYLVEQDDLGDNVYLPVAKGPTSVASVRATDLGVVAREIEEAYRHAGCTGVLYRVTVTAGDDNRQATAYTPPPSSPCGCPDCKPLRALTAVPDDNPDPEETTIDTEPESQSAWPDPIPLLDLGKIDRAIAAVRDRQSHMSGTFTEPYDEEVLDLLDAAEKMRTDLARQDPSDEQVADLLAWAEARGEKPRPLASTVRVHAWQLDSPAHVFVQVGDGPVCDVADPTRGRFEGLAADIAYGEAPAQTPALITPVDAAQKVATWTLTGGTELHVDADKLTPLAKSWIDPAPAGVDRDSWAASREFVSPDFHDELLANLDGFLKALMVRLDRDGFIVTVVDTSGWEVFRHARVA